MSFLLEDDTHATLQVALAFIDACDNEGASTSSPAISPNRTILPTISDSHNEKLAHFTAQGVPETSSHYEAVKRNRAKTKAEVTRLQDQVAALEENLRRLQRGEQASMQAHVQQQLWRTSGNREGARVFPAKTMSMWLEIATLRAQECQKSQALNAELREAVGKQTRLVDALKAMLSKKSNQFVSTYLPLYLLSLSQAGQTEQTDIVAITLLVYIGTSLAARGPEGVCVQQRLATAAAACSSRSPTAGRAPVLEPRSNILSRFLDRDYQLRRVYESTEARPHHWPP